MNWYKQIKLALPVDETIPSSHYMDYGHEGYFEIGDVEGMIFHKLEPEAQKSVKKKIDKNKETIWIMQKNYEIIENPAIGVNDIGIIKRYTHWDVWGLLDQSILAKGRYEGDNNIVSFVYTSALRGYSINRRNHVEKMMLRSVDKHFNNPKISVFN